MASVNSTTKNHDIDYIVKDFDSSVDALINFATVNFGSGSSANRLWSNFNVDSFSRNWLEIVAYVADLFFFYFDVQSTQAYLQTATIRSAVKDIAKQFGFVPTTATSASGTETFTVTGAGTIPRGFRVRSSTGIEYYLTNAIVASAAGNYTGSVLQGQIFTEQFSAQGLQNEEFDLSGIQIVRDLTNANPQDISPQVVVAGNSYTLVNTFIHSNGTDTNAVVDSLGVIIGGGGRVFTLEERPNGKNFIRFGDGVFGRKLVPGELITVTYRVGGGSSGNVAEESVRTAVDSNPIVASVNNAAKFSGGTDEQSIEQLRELIPASLRTLDRAVAESDYSDILEATFTEVSSVSTEHNTSDPGIDLNIYVVPTGVGISKITDNLPLKNKLSNFLERRKMVTVQFAILDAFGIDVLLSLKVFIIDTASKATVQKAIDTAFTKYFNLLTGGPNGSGISFAEKILTEHLTNIIETIPGIDRFEFTRHTYRPRIQQNVLGLNTAYTNSQVEVFPNVSESEWLLGAAGAVTKTSGTVIFSNTLLTGFTYNPVNGKVTYSAAVDLDGIAPGDQFRDGANVDFTIFGVDTKLSTLHIAPAMSVNNTVSNANHGSVRTGATVSESFKCFKKINANATNLSIDSITDNELNLSIKNGTGIPLSARVLLDNTQVFIANQYATGDFYLVDSSGNLWEIIENTSNTIKTSITAINDASVTNVATGSYKIVTKLVGYQIVFNGNIFNIQYNSEKTIYSIGAQFSNIGTIGDTFQISKLQNNIGTLGIAVDLVSYDSLTKQILLNDAPDLQGISSDWSLIDNSGQVFNLVGTDNRSLPSTFYENTNQDSSFILEDAGLGVQYAQGFKVGTNNVYSVVSFYLRRAGNAVGNLTAKIVNDDGTGLPNLGSVVATSLPISMTSLNVITGFDSLSTNPTTGFEKIIFTFASPPSLTASTQYHLVISGDASYVASQADNIKTFDNSGSIGYTYDNSSGIIQYSSPIDLSGVFPGNYFRDGTGKLFRILSVSDGDERVVLASGLSVDTSINTDSGSIYKKDSLYIASDVSSPNYSNGKASRYDGSFWANDTQGPVPNRFSSNTDLPFTVEGPRSVKVDSNLTPILGAGATISKRYYDDNAEISLILGLSSGTITSAPDVNSNGRGTVNTIPNSKVDNFIFRTSHFVDDIVNLRLNEIPEYSSSNAMIEVLGGID